MKTAFSILLVTIYSGIGIMAASKPSFDRYQVILDRKPFGDPPPAPIIVPKKIEKPFNPALSFTKDFRMSSIKIIEGSGVSVGLVEKNTRSIILQEGEVDEASGLKLIKASYDTNEATLTLGEETATLKLDGGTPAKTASSSSRSSRSKSARSPTKPTFAKKFTPVVTRRSSSSKKLPTPKYTGEELKKHLQDYNMEVIRKGLPPLPIALTKEQDSKLVQEGVLPPNE